MKIVYFIFGSLLLLSSCLKDKYNFDNLEPNVSPTYALPLVDISIELKDVIDAVQSDILQTDANGELLLVYSDTLLSIVFDSIVDIPGIDTSFSVGIDPVKIEDVSFQGSITLGEAAPNFTEPNKTLLASSDGKKAILPASGNQDLGLFTAGSISEFQQVTFSKGTIEATLTNNWPVDIDNFLVALVNKATGLAIDTFDFGLVPAGTQKMVPSTLKNKTLYSDLEVDLYSIETLATSDSVLIDLSKDLVFDIEISNAEIIRGVANVQQTELVADTFDINLNLDNGAEMEELVFKGGAFLMDVDYQIETNTEMVISMPYATKNGVPFILTKTLQKGADNSSNIDLTGYSFDLTKGGTTFNQFEIILKSTILAGNNIAFDTSNGMSALISIIDLEIASARGYFGSTEELLNNFAEVDFGSNNIVKSFEFVEPEIKLLFDNSFGIPFSLDEIDLIMKGTNTVTLTGLDNSIPINPSLSMGTSVTSELIIGSNTNIADALNSQPDEVSASGKVKINPAGKTSNFALDTSRLNVRIELEVPLYGRMKNYTFIDTLDQDLEDIFDAVESVTLRSIITNQLPVDGLIQMYFADENYLILDSISVDKGTQILIAAPVDANGNVTNKTKQVSDFVLSTDKIERIKTTKHLIIKSTLNTADNGSVAARLYEDYTLDIKLGIIAKVNLSSATDE